MGQDRGQFADIALFCLDDVVVVDDKRLLLSVVESVTKRKFLSLIATT